MVLHISKFVENIGTTRILWLFWKYYNCKWFSTTFTGHEILVFHALPFVSFKNIQYFELNFKKDEIWL